MNDAELVLRHKSPTAWFTHPDQFTGAGIANYYVRDSDRYDYMMQIVHWAGLRYAGQINSFSRRS